jgi:hypothetical protein
MNKLIYQNNFGNYLYTYISKNTSYEFWIIHYQNHLKQLFELFQITCSNNNITWYSNISFEDFSLFVYKNSSKYLSPWV